MLPLSLYIHIPWCIRKCPYCDFNSHKSPTELPEDDYIAALITDFQDDLARFPGREIDSIFIGGGTPSLFSAQSFEKLFDALTQQVTFKQGIEITLEANPGTVEQQRFNAYRALGINRLSLGIQSFNPVHLHALGRIHDDKQARLAIESARIAGFDNINIDIMHGLPNQSIKQGLEDLHTAIAYAPEHLSWYQLTIEPNTQFYKQRPILPTEEETDTIENEGLVMLAQNGFNRYEISAFCKPDKAARHNLNYWLFGDYYGIGAGAHGKLTDTQGRVYRTRKHRQPRDYLSVQKPFLAEIKEVASNELVFEFMLNATRLQQAIDLSLFSQCTGLELQFLLPKLELAQSKKLISLTNTDWQITPLGRRYTNDLQILFLPEN